MKRLVLLPMLLFPSFLMSQVRVDNSPELGNYPIKNFSPEEYQAHFQNWAITQDKNGFIYAGNGNGILEYDGETWRLIPLDDLNAVRAVTVDEDNVKWIGADRELGYLEPDSLGFLQFKSLKNKIPPSHPLTANVWNVFHTKDGIIFRGGNNIYLWKQNKFEVVPEVGKIHTGFQVGQDVFFRVYDKGLFLLKDGTLQLIPQGHIFKDLRLYAALPFKNNTILLGTRDAGLFLYNGTSIAKFQNDIDDYLITNRLYNGLALPDSSFAFTTLSGGLIIMDGNGKRSRIITKKNGLLNDEVYGICLDNRNGLWLALQTGISYLEYLSPYTFFDEKTGLEGTVDAITRHNGKLYVATYGGLYEQHNSPEQGGYQFKRIKEINSGCTALLSVGESLIVLTDDGTIQITNGAIKKLNNLKGVAAFQSQKVPNRIFIGHKDGLSTLFFSEGEWQNEGEIEKIKEESISITETGNGSVWLGTRVNGVIKIEFSDFAENALKDSVIQRYGPEHHLSEGWNKVFTIDGELWVTANTEKESPLLKFDFKENKFLQTLEFGKKFGLDSIPLYPLASQDNGAYILLKSFPSEGVPSRFSAFRDMKTGKYSLEKLQDWRFKSNNEAFWDNNNVLWLGKEELVRYNLGKESSSNPVHKAYVRKVVTAQDSILFGGEPSRTNAPKLAYSHDGLRFQFATPTFDGPSANKYQYFLRGFDEKWSEWSNETKKEYTNVHEGDYQFMVRSRDNYGEIGDYDTFDFTILPPWYRSWWAYLIYLLLFSGFLWAILKLRSRQLKAHNEALERLIAVRTSEVQHQANQLKIQALKLQEFDKAKSRFFANISHEFRTPLTLIKGPIEQLEQNFTEKLSMETVKMIRRNANRLLNMVNQLLDLSKIDEGSLKLAPTEGDVYKCLRTASSSFNSHAAQRNMDYRVEILPTVLWASFDRDKLENIVYNLLGNAFKFSRDGSKISFIADYNEGALLIKVSDAGKGIAIEKLPYIFDRFYQAESGDTREKEGSGIGLSLSKDLVELMDGTITVSSEVDLGTLFTVQLPIQEIKTRQKHPIDDVPQMEKSLVKRPFALSTSDKRNLPTVLLVEDNADMLHFIKEHLVKFYKVNEAINGEAGLQKAKADSPDLIITDLMMPKMDGIELCRELKTDVHTSHIPVIMLTAKAGIENKIEGLETGADDYLTKPFDGKELLVRSRNLIEQRQKLRELYGNKEIQLDPRKVTATSIDQKFLEQVLELLETNFSDPEFGVPHMQDALAMSKTQLHRKLKALTNEAPGELLRNFRLKRAAQLLLQKSDSVTQIAYMVGFNNLSYFAKCFKELYGVAPSTY
ncbi:response regulator [Algoriphagus sp. D3-2-R+10]|uniref:hybrid sensor histidine kinase/response regulator transcription factor n=1 Tax=Algoriphagus aurantiacus TaxID=3103948 RepID=UPI002B36E1C8|nr:response regulator [Algoriphagus sp. D3-2-R+10]MEB2778138.1 response regulator [Algoriphagus sp. D3-2-R+10]